MLSFIVFITGTFLLIVFIVTGHHFHVGGLGHVALASDQWSLIAGRMQVPRGVDLVYGGGGIGLMGLVSRTVHAGGRRVIGYGTVRHHDIEY